MIFTHPPSWPLESINYDIHVSGCLCPAAPEGARSAQQDIYILVNEIYDILTYRFSVLPKLNEVFPLQNTKNNCLVHLWHFELVFESLAFAICKINKGESANENDHASAKLSNTSSKCKSFTKPICLVFFTTELQQVKVQH